MRILIATGLYPPEAGGPATYSKLLKDELPKRGIGVRVVPFHLVRWMPRFVRHIVYAKLLFFASFGVEIVYAQDPVSVGLPAYWVSQLTGKRLMLKVVGDYAWEQGVQRFGVRDTLDVFAKKRDGYAPFVQRLKSIQCRVAESAECIIVPSMYLKNIVASWGVSEGNIRVIYNAFDISETEKARPAPETRGALVSVGRLVPWKGFSELIAVMPELHKTWPNLKLFIVGDGPERDGLVRKIQALGLENLVTLTGRLSHKKTISYMRGARVFVLNTRYEGFSHTLLEALAAGVPIVTTDVGGNSELIENERTGLLVQPDDSEALTEAISRVLSDSSLRERLRTEGLKQARLFTRERMLDDTAQVLHGV